MYDSYKRQVFDLRPASLPQRKLIMALAWKLRAYYTFLQWGEIRVQFVALLAKKPTSMWQHHRFIRKWCSVLNQKQAQNAKQIWLPTDYRLDNPSWQDNIARMKAWLVFREAGLLEDSSLPDPAIEKELQSYACLMVRLLTVLRKDLAIWHSLKNQIEREELKHASEVVFDEFENDTRSAEIEEERWLVNRRPYSELVEGIDFLKPVAGIDF